MKTRQPIRLGSEIGRGGEGTIYRIEGDRNRIAKIYHEALNALHQRKLVAITRVASPNLSKVTAWPEEIISDNSGKMRGLIMPFADNRRPLHQLYASGDRRQYFPNSDWSFLVHTARNLAAVVETVHSAGHVIGDINESGALVDKRGTIVLIDCDSFHINEGGRSYRCLVGKPDYTPPELQGIPYAQIDRKPEHDAFGLGILIFQILFMGRHPFAGVTKNLQNIPTPAENIKHGRFAYCRTPRTDIVAPVHTLRLEHLPGSIAALFEASFLEEAVKRPSPFTWRKALDEFKKTLAYCPDIKTHRVPNGTGPCVWCKIELAGGPSFFPGELTATSSFHKYADIKSIYNQIDRITSAAKLPSRLTPQVKLTVFSSQSAEKHAINSLRIPAPPTLPLLKLEELPNFPELQPDPPAPGLEDLPEYPESPKPLARKPSPKLKEPHWLPSKPIDLIELNRRLKNAQINKLEPMRTIFWLAISGCCVFGTWMSTQHQKNQALLLWLIAATIFCGWAAVTMPFRFEWRRKRKLSIREAEEWNLEADRTLQLYESKKIELLQKYKQELILHELYLKDLDRRDSDNYDSWKLLCGQITKKRIEIESRNANKNALWLQDADNRSAIRRQEWREACAAVENERARIEHRNTQKTIRYEEQKLKYDDERNFYLIQQQRLEQLKRDYRQEYKRRDDQLSQAKNGANTIDREWLEILASWRFNHDQIVQSLASSRKAYENIESRYEEECRKYANRAEPIQREAYLRRQILRPGQIDAIGTGRIETLRQYGIESAADISYQRLRSVPGFGNRLTTNLMAWRRLREGSFCFNSQQALPQDVKRKIMTKYQPSFDRTRRKILGDIERSNSLHSEIKKLERQYQQKVNLAYKIVMQAEADLKVMPAL